MDNHLQSGAPVDLNALLPGEKATLEGCQVIRVSNHGMLLHCEPEDLSLTYGQGDPVDIHLTVQHGGEQKKLTIPAHIRHVVKSSLDVEFQHPDPVLLDLIESYRTSDAHQLEAVIGKAQARQDRPGNMPLAKKKLPGKADKSAPTKPGGTARRRHLLIPGLLILSVLATLLVGTYFMTNSLQHRLSVLETLADNRGNEFAEMQDKLFSASLLEGRYASLDARISALGDAVADLDRQLHSDPTHTTPTNAVNTQPADVPPVAAVKLDATPAAAMEAAPTPAVQSPEPDDIAVQEKSPTSQTAPTAQAVEPEIQQPEAASEPDTPVTPTKHAGPWVINLMSSRDRHYLETIARKAQSSHIPTELNSARVKGKDYWRLQVTGFNSLAEAKARAVDIRQTMGIGEVWFLKRKPGSQ